jgi:hypothetical protein
MAINACLGSRRWWFLEVNLDGFNFGNVAVSEVSDAQNPGDFLKLIRVNGPLSNNLPLVRLYNITAHCFLQQS